MDADLIALLVIGTFLAIAALGFVAGLREKIRLDRFLRRQRTCTHAWDGCVCTLCHLKRDQGHDWQGCHCTKCGEDSHVWESSPTVEGIPGVASVEFDDYVCKRCGARSEQKYSSNYRTG